MVHQLPMATHSDIAGRLSRFLRSGIGREPGLVLALAAAAAAVALTQGPASGLAQRIETLPASAPQRPYDFARLETFNRVLFHVTYEYVDPSRVEPRRMFLAALNGIEKAVPEVIVTGGEETDEVVVQIGPHRQSFRARDVDSPWRLAARMHAVAQFLSGKFVSDQVRRKPQDVEYAAVNGMLRTLDPHTVLMSPEANRDMRANTAGQFGGIGINIGIRDGYLTVISPIHDTPAWRAGLKPNDRIVQIDDESTINMDIDEAVSRLRGRPGTVVAVWIMRRGWTEPRPFPITRATIPIESVKYAMLEGDVGYVQVRQFQRNTVRDVRSAIEKLRGQGMRRLILDLRDDPGGVLEGSIELADLFLRSGVILTTAGNDPRENSVETASGAGTEPDYPIAVLVNNGSASASEIVAGALKNSGRAIVIGRTTFGKGSVQAIHEFPDDAALKITIAQYLTPGDISIQSVGIVPDIETLPMAFNPNGMDLYVAGRRWSEARLRSHLPAERAAVEQKPARTVRYFVDGAEEDRANEPDDDGVENAPPPPGSILLQPGDEPIKHDFEIKLAREALAAAGDSNRRRILAGVGPLLERLEREEDVRLTDALRGIGMDWTAAPGPPAAGDAARVTATLDRGGDAPIRPGDQVKLRLWVRNDGTAPLYRLRAVSESDNHVFSDREFLFGRLDPGGTRDWTVELKMPRHASARIDPIKFVFAADGAPDMEPVEFRVPIAGLGHPLFGYRLTTIDDVQGNADGLVQRGETVRLRLEVRNLGDAPALKPVASIRNRSGDGIFIRTGREELPEIPPGGRANASFELEVRGTYERAEFELGVSVVDIEMRDVVAELMRIPLAPPPASPPAPTAGIVAVRAEGARLRSVPDPAADPIGTLPPGARLRRTHTAPGWVRVGLPDEPGARRGYAGWVSQDEVQETRGRPSPSVPLAVRLANAQPRLAFPEPPPPAVREADLVVRGIVEDDDPILDLYAFVGENKVFYTNHRGAADPRRLEFSITLPLRGGSNVVTLFAREANEVTTTRDLVIRRDAPDGSTMATEDDEDEPGIEE